MMNKITDTYYGNKTGEKGAIKRLKVCGTDEGGFEFRSKIEQEEKIGETGEQNQ